MALLEPIGETMAILFLLLVASNGIPGQASTFGAMLAILAVLTVVRIAKRTNITARDIGFGVIGLFVLTSARLQLESLGLLVAIVAIGRLLLVLIRWAWYEHRYITDRRVMETSGFLHRRVSSMPLSKLTDLTLHRSSLAEFLDYGRLVVESAGQDQALSNIDYLMDPLVFHELVVRLATNPYEMS